MDQNLEGGSKIKYKNLKEDGKKHESRAGPYITLLFCDLCDKESNEMISFFKPL